MEQQTSLIPIVVGVTGHRDLRAREAPRIRDAVRDILVDTLHRYPDSPVELVSGLAGGADQLATIAALDLQASAIDGADRLRVSAILPMPADLYRASLDAASPRVPTDASERQTFDELIERLDRQSHATRLIELPLIDPTRTRLLDAREVASEPTGAWKERQYALLGDYLLHHSQILVAIWSGVAAQKPAGTAAVVRMNLSSVDSGTAADVLYPEEARSERGPLKALPFVSSRDASPLQQPDNGPVFWIPARRSAESARLEESDGWRLRRPDVECFGWEQAVSDGEQPWYPLYPAFWEHDADDDASPGEAVARVRAHYEKLLSLIDAYNRDVERAGSGSRRSTTEPAALGDVSAHFHQAEELANRYQRSSRVNYTALLFSVVLAFTCFSVFDLFPFMPSTVLLVAFPVILLLGYLLFRRPLSHSSEATVRRRARRDFEWRHYSYRAFAEALRVKRSWALAGVAEHIPGRYLRRYRGELKWVEYAVATVSREADTLLWSEPADDALAGIRTVQTTWIDGQLGYLNDRIGELARKDRRLSRLGSVAFGLALVTVITLLLGTKLVHMIVAGDFSTWADLTDLTAADGSAYPVLYGLAVGLTDLLMAAGAAFSTYAERTTISQRVEEYRSQRLAFQVARRRLAAALEGSAPEEARRDRARRILLALGREAVAENADWFVFQTANSMEMPL